MPAKKKMKVEKNSFEEKERYEEEIKALKIVIEGKNETIQAFEDEVRQAGETNDNLKRKLNIVEKLKDKVECPVCMEIPRAGPVPVCPNGHVVCQVCMRGTCPTCRVHMGTGKSLLAITIIENIEHKCKFDDCEEYFHVDIVEEHIKVCPHRTVCCPKRNCKAEFGLSKLLDHLNKGNCSHHSAFVRIEGYPDYPYAQRLKYAVDEVLKSAANIASKLSTFSFGDASFCVFLEKHAEMYHFCCLMFSSENECSKYKIKMAVHEEVAKEDSEICHKFDGRPFSIDEDKEEILGLGLSVSCKAMEKMMRKSRSNFFNLTFSIMKTCEPQQ